MNFLKTSFLVGVILSTICMAILTGFVFTTLYQLDGVKSLETYKPPTATQILDINNQVIAEFYREKRELVTFEDLSPYLIEATLSIEDKRFFSHYGIDFIRILKAFWVNFKSLSKRQGGSTITIQLSKLIFLNYEKTFSRKLTELWYAIQIERQYTKEEILKFYFNQVNYGHGAYGVGAASKFFFGKSPSKLSIAEAALLSGIPKAPTSYSPIRYPKKSSERHRAVLSAMVRNNFISAATATEVYADFWSYFKSKNRSRQSSFSDLSKNQAPYFTEYIRAKLERDFTKNELYEKGIKVYTTLNLNHQKVAQKLLWEKLQEQDEYKKKIQSFVPQELNLGLLAQINEYGKLFGIPQLDMGKPLNVARAIKEIEATQGVLKDGLTLFGLNLPSKLTRFARHQFTSDLDSSSAESVQGAILAIEPKTGHITTMVGGKPFNYNNQFNRAIDLRRQVGSILKPFVYALAIDKNIIRANTILNDAPTQFGDYIPKNYSGYYRGKVSVRDALRKSINVLAVEMLNRVGVSYARDRLARIFGATTETSINRQFPRNLTLALGTGSFSVLSVATAYAVLANEGREVIPKTIRYVTDQNGEMIKNYEEEYSQLKERQLIDRGTVYIIRKIIQDVFSPGGTAYKPTLLKDFKHRANSFGKTGTTSNWKDTWFAGANDYLSSAVWIGYDNNQSLGRNRTGGKMAAPIWINFNNQALKSKPVSLASPPKEIIRKKICTLCEGLAGPSCPKNKVRSEYFKIDNYPKEICYNSAYQKKQKEDKSNFADFIKNFRAKN